MNTRRIPRSANDTSKRSESAFRGVQVIRRLLEAGYTEERGMAFPLAPVCGTVYWTGKLATPLHLFLVRSHREGIRRTSPSGDPRRSCKEMETGDELRGALHS